MSQVADIAQEAATSWFAEQLSAVASAEAADDRQVAMVERSAPAGFMPPLAERDEPETYRVVAGEVTFFIGDDVIEAEAGDIVLAAAGVARSFQTGSEGARWLVLTRVESLDYFVDFGRAVAPPRESGEWPSSAELAAVAAIATANGIRLLGPPGALPTPGV